jgi:hypothetical protein
MSSRLGTVVGTQVGSRVSPIALPSGFPWSPAWGIGAGPGRGYRPGLDSASLRTTPVTTIYVSTTGNNANSGASPAQAKRNFAPGTGAYSSISGATRIVVEAGDYYNDQGWRGLAMSTETTYLEIVASGGRVRMLSQEAALTYSSAGSGAYSATLATAPFGVYDETQVDAYGAGTWLTQQANLAAVQASGGWFHSAGVLYVKTFDSRSPDRWVCAAQTGKNGFVGNSASLSTYHSGVDWIGFVTGIYAVNSNRTIIEDCRAIASQTDGLRVAACTDAYLFRSEAHASYNGDGILYGATGNILEVDCVGLSNGWSASDTSNASTAHGATVIRCGGVYLNSKGPNVADVVSSKSLTLGARIGTSRGAGVQSTNVASDGATGKMWLADCQLYGATSDIYTLNAGAVVYTRNTGYANPTGVGTVGTW